jgi:FMN reductase
MIDATQAGPVLVGPLVVGLGGSTSPSSGTDRLLRRCLELADGRGARTIAFTGAELATLPIFSGSDAPVAAAEALTSAVRAADAVVIATPGYHGGMSGLVKNALDHLELLRDDARPYLDGRAVGVIVSAAGWQACGSALASVRSTIHALRGWPTPFGVTVNSVEQPPDADGRFDPRVEAALGVLVGQLMDFAGWQPGPVAGSR